MDIDEAKKLLGNEIGSKGELYNLYPYIKYDAGNCQVRLDGDFNAIDLEAIACYMRHTMKEKGMSDEGL